MGIIWHNFHPNGKEYSHTQFTEEVAYNLLISENESLDFTGTSEEEAGNSPQQHDIKPLGSLDVYSKSGKRGRRRCHECGSSSAYYCTTCSDLKNGKIISICGLKSKHGSACVNAAHLCCSKYMTMITIMYIVQLSYFVFWYELAFVYRSLEIKLWLPSTKSNDSYFLMRFILFRT